MFSKPKPPEPLHIVVTLRLADLTPQQIEGFRRSQAHQTVLLKEILIAVAKDPSVIQRAVDTLDEDADRLTRAMQGLKSTQPTKGDSK